MFFWILTFLLFVFLLKFMLGKIFLFFEGVFRSYSWIWGQKYLLVGSGDHMRWQGSNLGQSQISKVQSKHPIAVLSLGPQGKLLNTLQLELYMLIILYVLVLLIIHEYFLIYIFAIAYKEYLIKYYSIRQCLLCNWYITRS